MISSIISALPQIVGLIVRFVNFMHDRGLIDEGRKLAAADALEASARELRTAKQAEVEADAAHAANPASDEAFDRDFERK